MLIGQRGEHACIKSMGHRDKECEPRNKYAYDPLSNSKTKQVKNLVIEDGAGGGGGGTYVFLLNGAKVAVPLVVAGGGGGLGIGRYFSDQSQHGHSMDLDRPEVSGQKHGELNKTGGPGGGWRAKFDHALSPEVGASLLEGGRGGEPCYTARGFHGQGGFGGGGGGCMTGGGGGGYTGGDTMDMRTHGEGAYSFVGKRTVEELSKILPGDNSGSGSVVIIPAIPTPSCGCEYLCVALDEFTTNVACICPEGWRLKRDNLTACECKFRFF